MDLRKFFRRNIHPPAWYSPGSAVKTVVTVDHSPTSLRNRINNGEVRLIVERQFMRMNESHERIRTELLATHSQRV